MGRETSWWSPLAWKRWSPVLEWIRIREFDHLWLKCRGWTHVKLPPNALTEKILQVPTDLPFLQGLLPTLYTGDFPLTGYFFSAVTPRAPARAKEQPGSWNTLSHSRPQPQRPKVPFCKLTDIPWCLPLKHVPSTSVWISMHFNPLG